MFRKLSLVAAAALSLGAAAMAPTPAAAWGGWHGGYGGWHGGYYHAWYRPWGWGRRDYGWSGPRFYAAPIHYGYGGGCYARRVVPTPWGPRWRLVNHCY